MIKENKLENYSVRSVIAACLLFSCGASHAQGVPEVLNIGTHGLGTNVYANGVGLSRVLSDNLDSNVNVRPTSGPTEWLPQISTGEIQLGVLSNFDALHGREGTSGYDQVVGDGAPIYLLTSGSRSFAAPLAAGDAEVKTCDDFRGKRIIDHYSGTAGVTAQSRAVIANCKLGENDYRSVTIAGSPGAAVQALIDGTADVVASSAVGMGIIAELDARRGARFVSIDPSPEAMERYNKHYPASPLVVEPAEGRVGVLEPINVASYAFYLVGAEGLSDETAYQVVKVLWENNEDLFPLHVNLRDWVKDSFVREDATIPYHPGAIKFYREIGAWTENMDQVQASLLNR